MRIVISGFLVLFILSPAFGTTNLLRLERSEVPGGPWQEVPANTIPITTEGAFQDTYSSATGYYHMRIEPGDGWGFPLNIPFEDVPATTKGIATDLLGSSRGLEGWEDAMLGPIVFPVYTPGIDGPAYMEFALLGPQPEPPDMPFGGPGQKPDPTSRTQKPLMIGDSGMPRGYILVSLTEDDFPVVSFATEGFTRTERLRRMCGTSAARIVRYLGGFTAAEDQGGNLIGYLGDPPIRFASGILDYADEHYVEWVNPKDSYHPPAPPVQFGPYASYGEFKNDYLSSAVYQEMRKRLREAAKPEWDAELGRVPEEIVIPLGQDVVILKNEVVKSLTLDDPSLVDYKILALGVQMHGLKPGVTPMHVVFVGDRKAEYILGVSQMPLGAEEPAGFVWTAWEYWYADFTSFQRNYSQEDGDDCSSGCGATAWAMMYGFWDMWDCFAEWFGFPDMVPGDLIAGECPTPLTNNAAVRDCIWYIVPRIQTYCSGSQGATNPWDMDAGYEWADHTGGVIDHYARYTAPLLAWTWNGPRELAEDEIKNDRPSVVGFDWHYALAYGFRYREKRGERTGWVVSRKREVLCNMGWGGTTPEWHNAEDLWYAARNILFWP
ncbi:MAG: hypothetical protein Q8Q12_12750 [bacterium]|nr:hypothetical protein [bacterium]